MRKHTRGALAAALAIAATLAAAPAHAADIAYESNNRIYTANANGTGSQLLLEPFDVYGSTGVYKSPQLNNAGTHLVSSSECSNWAPFCSYVAVTPMNDPSLTHVVAYINEWQFRDARWKPMGDRVVFSVYRPGIPRGFDIDTTRVMYSNGEDGYPAGTPYGGEPDGTPSKGIIEWNGNQRHPEFSGDGSKLVFDSNANSSGTLYSDGQTRVFVANADGSGARELGVGSDPSISPSGSTVVFQKPPKSGSPTQIYSVSASGGTPVRLTSNRVTDREPEWTGDGTKIMFTRCSTTCALYTMTPSGGSQGQLVANAQAGTGRQARLGTDFNVALEKYVPQLRYDSQETFFADSAATMTDNYTSGSPGNTLQRQDGTVLATANPATGPQPLSMGFLNWPTYTTGGQVSQYTDKIDAGNSYESDAQRLHANYTYRDKIYSRVKQDSAGKTWLQYWFFYYYNPYDVFCCGVGVHEGDWEMIQLGLDGTGTPDVVTYAQHKDEDAEQCTWSQVEKWRSTQGDVPVVYVARGSHASYTTAGDHNLAWFAVQDEADGQGTRVRPAATQINDTAPSWVKWQGQWGGSDSSPRGPSEQGNKWTAPDAFHAQARGCERQAGAPKQRDPGASPRDPSAPAVSARVSGRRAEVDYRFERGFDSKPAPHTILVTVHPKGKGLAPSSRTVRVRSRNGRVRVRLPHGSGPYTVRASALTKDGARSKVVRARVR